MKTYRDLLKTDTFWITKIQNDVYNAVEEYLSENNMTRSQFARQLGVSKGYISQVLNGDFNHRLSKLVELVLAIGKVPSFDLEDIGEVIRKKEAGFVRHRPTYVRKNKRKVSTMMLSYDQAKGSKQTIDHPEDQARLVKGVFKVDNSMRTRETLPDNDPFLSNRDAS